MAISPQPASIETSRGPKSLAGFQPACVIGEEITLLDDRLYVNGVATEETFLREVAGLSQKYEWWPRSDEYVVLGDNRDASTDSRKFGPVPITAFRGRIERRLR